jgi:hypothetical protein
MSASRFALCERQSGTRTLEYMKLYDWFLFSRASQGRSEAWVDPELWIFILHILIAPLVLLLSAKQFEQLVYHGRGSPTPHQRRNLSELPN